MIDNRDVLWTERWIYELMQGRKMPIVLVINKCDLDAVQREARTCAGYGSYTEIKDRIHVITTRFVDVVPFVVITCILSLICL
jgi:GTPase SAR1 family protein